MTQNKLNIDRGDEELNIGDEVDTEIGDENKFSVNSQLIIKRLILNSEGSVILNLPNYQ